MLLFPLLGGACAMAYESYLNKGGTKREISMAEIGTGKHVIAGYVGKDGAIRRIPSLGRISYLSVRIMSLVVQNSDGTLLNDSVYIESYSTRYNIYSDSSKETLYGYISVSSKASSTMGANLSLQVSTEGIHIQALVRLYAVYPDGHEISLYDLNQKTGSSFYGLTTQCQVLHSMYESPTVEVVVRYDGAKTLYNDTSYSESTIDFSFGLFNLEVDLYSGSYVTGVIYFGTSVTDRDGNTVQINGGSYPDSWTD